MDLDAQTLAWPAARNQPPPRPAPPCSTLIDLLRFRAIRQPDAHGHRFLSSSNAAPVTLTHAELDRRARAIAVLLARLDAGGRQVHLLFPPGPEWVSAFFGCLYAGAVVVPSPPCINSPAPARLLAVMRAARGDVVLTTSAVEAVVRRRLADVSEGCAVRWLAVDRLPPGLEEGWKWPRVRADTVAVRRASRPRKRLLRAGLTHGELLERLAVTQACLPPSRHGVTWLAPYPETALLGALLQPLYGGFGMTIMPPFGFLESPLAWLDTVSHARAGFTRAPSFAYELCVRRLRHTLPRGLDLSCLDAAFCPPGPMRAETLGRFAVAFAPFGFRRSVLQR